MSKLPNELASKNEYHQPVLVEQLLAALKPEAGSTYLDATFGGGGHAAYLLEAGAKVIGLDQDSDALQQGRLLQKHYPNQLKLHQTNFVNLDQILKQEELISACDGIYFDVGVSSWQLDSAARGFSFQADAPLDMRMDQSLQVTAADLIAALSVKELTKLIHKYGQDSRAKQIAKAIVNQRQQQPINTTKQLADLIHRVYRGKRGKLHPATKTFQALRIAVNDELNSLELALPKALVGLKPGGVLAVISFHELEDRIVKQFFKKSAEQNQIEIVTQKPIEPEPDQIKANIRSRSAKLRYAYKK